MSEIFRPTKAGGGNYLGIQKIGIVDIKDRNEEMDWADIFLEITVNSEHSKYNDKIVISGELNKDADGNLAPSPVLARLYGFIDGAGLAFGLDVKGNWVDSNGEAIPNIQNYLYTALCNVDDNGKPEKHPYVAYFYKKWSKGRKRAFTEVHTHIFADTAEGHAKLADRIKYLKSQGYLIEHVPTVKDAPSQTQSDPDSF
jgi:hypothetical protein